MDNIFVILVCAILLLISVSAQDLPVQWRIKPNLPEEVTITDQRSLLQIRRQMQEAEVAAYDIFNR